MLKKKIDQQPEGPDDAQRAEGYSILLGEAVNEAGDRVVSRLRTPEGYSLTALTSLEIVRRVMQGNAVPGYQTPSSVFGPDFITEFPGCELEDLNSA